MTPQQYDDIDTCRSHVVSKCFQFAICATMTRKVQYLKIVRFNIIFQTHKKRQTEFVGKVSITESNELLELLLYTTNSHETQFLDLLFMA